MSEPEPTPVQTPGGPGKFSRDLRRHFLTGLLVVTPTVVAAWVLYRLFTWVDGLLWENFRFGWVWPGGIPGVGAITVLALVILVGIVVNNYLGRRLYQFWESVVVRIPLFNKIYLAVKQIGEALLSSERSVFRAVGMIEYPRRGIWCVVFLTEIPGREVQEVAGVLVRSVFLPTTPNPTSGFLLMVPEEDIHYLNMSVEDGLKMVISGGAFVPGESALPAPTRRVRTRRRWWKRGSAPPAEPAPEPTPEPSPDRDSGKDPV